MTHRDAQRILTSVNAAVKQPYGFFYTDTVADYKAIENMSTAHLANAIWREAPLFRCFDEAYQGDGRSGDGDVYDLHREAIESLRETTLFQ